MKTHTVSVTVGTSSISVQPDTQVMTTADEIQWASTNGKRFSIEFDHPDPFGRPNLDFPAATARRRPQSLGRFKYTVVSDENPAQRLDPVIIVDPPPTGEQP